MDKTRRYAICSACNTYRAVRGSGPDGKPLCNMCHPNKQEKGYNMHQRAAIDTRLLYGKTRPGPGRAQWWR